MKVSGLLASALSAAALVVLAQEKASAVLVYQLDVTPDGTGLVLSTSGSLSNLPTPQFQVGQCASGGAVGAIGPAGLCTGIDNFLFDAYLVEVITPNPLAGIIPAVATSTDVGSIPTNFNALAGYIWFGQGFSLGQEVFSRSTFANTTFKDLNLSPSTTVGTWNLLGAQGGIADTIDFRTGPLGDAGNGNPTSVPGPLPLAGGAAAFAWSRRLRARLRRFSPPQP